MTPALAAMELRWVRLPLARPFVGAAGTETHKEAVLVRAVDDDGGEGWGECPALSRPGYSGEWAEGAWRVLQRVVVPAVLAGRGWRVRGHPMACGAVEVALLDLVLRRQGRSLAEHLGAVRDRVPCGVAVGEAVDLDDLVQEVAGHVAAGYRRVKLKIRPEWDVEPVAAVRAAFPRLALSVDANGSYDRDGAERLRALDRFQLVEVEQPLPPDDLVGSARLAARLVTPVCLDEAVGSVAALEAAAALGAGRVVNVKPARVGGVAEAAAVVAAAARCGIGAWVGGMLDTGVGKAVGAVVAALPGVGAPGDLPASSRWFAEDLTDPFEMAPDGTMTVPTAPGIGVAPDPGRLARATVQAVVLRR